MSSLIINNLPHIEKYSYLELGVRNPEENFLQIKCGKKFSVDINGQGMFTGTTDDYFKQLSSDEKFDIIFIDANHDFDFVLRYFNNATHHAKSWVIIHDMVPPSIEFTSQDFCSDSYKLLFYFLIEKNFEIYSTKENYGLTFIKMPAEPVNPPYSYCEVTYEEFMNYVNKNYKLYTESELVNYFIKNRKF